jgi:hypothetical protein
MKRIKPKTVNGFTTQRCITDEKHRKISNIPEHSNAGGRGARRSGLRLADNMRGFFAPRGRVHLEVQPRAWLSEIRDNDVENTECPAAYTHNEAGDGAAAQQPASAKRDVGADG